MAALQEQARLAPLAVRPLRGQWQDLFGRLWTSLGARIGLVILVLFVLLALVAPVVLPYNPATDTNLVDRLQPPSATHPLGTDDLGRDELRRVVYGARISLRIGLIAVLIGSS